MLFLYFWLKLMMNKPTIDDALKEARRELQMRRDIYPQWVQNQRITPRTAAHRIACMELIVAMLAAQVPEQGDLFGGTPNG
jgi:hypothetical protein